MSTVNIKPGTRSQPQPPFPAQHLPKPGLEKDLHPHPNYQAPGYHGSNKLLNKVAFITGGDSGIGRAVAVLFAREGAKIVFTHLAAEKPDAAKTTEAIKKEGSTALSLEVDVTSFQQVKSAVDQAVSHFDRLDIVVNNAAFQQHQSGIENLSLEQWDQTFKTNIYGYFYVVKASLPYLQPGSVIINTGSVTALDGSAGLLDYAATKGAIHSFTKSLAQNLIDRDIRVNAVAPGPVWTPLNPADRPAEDITTFGSNVPLKRPAQPEEIAPAYVYLASPVDSSYVSGEVLTLWGGKTTAA